MLLNIGVFVIGLALLYYGAEWLVKGSSSLARSLGLSPVVIGLTVVAFGTSSPELFVSVVSSIEDKSMIAVGNVIGSNICNIALVLGLSATLLPIRGDRAVVRRDIPVMLGVSLLLLLFTLDSHISRLEGGILFAGVIAYTWLNIHLTRRWMRRHGVNGDVGVPAVGELSEVVFVDKRGAQLFFVILGIAGVVGGAELLISAAVSIMQVLGVSEKFIGLTIVAFGTSLPELATSVVAALRREMDISIGNLVGSNVFNIMSVLGVASLLRPIPIPGGFYASGMWIDYGVMMGTSALPWLFMREDHVVGRKGGLVLLACYCGYLTYLITETMFL
ncbi:MAG: calcium/sodium antiporter [Desulfatibacillaceae bacterium]